MFSKKKAFGYVEAILSVAILMLVIVPILNLNSKQIKTFNKIDLEKEKLNFFENIYLILKTADINLLEEYQGEYEFNNFDELKNFKIFFDVFSDEKIYNFEKIKNIEEFSLKINIKKDFINFSSNHINKNLEEAFLIDLKMKIKEKYYEANILRFK